MLLYNRNSVSDVLWREKSVVKGMLKSNISFQRLSRIWRPLLTILKFALKCCYMIKIQSVTSYEGKNLCWKGFWKTWDTNWNLHSIYPQFLSRCLKMLGMKSNMWYQVIATSNQQQPSLCQHKPQINSEIWRHLSKVTDTSPLMCV